MLSIPEKSKFRKDLGPYMLLLSLWLAKDMVEEAEARGEPFTVKKAFIDVLEVTAIMLILIIVAEIILR